MADGVMHGIVETADWFDDFEEEAEALEDVRADEMRTEFNRQQEAERQRREADEKKRLAPIVKKLVADPRFVAHKLAPPNGSLLRRRCFLRWIAPRSRRPSKRPLPKFG